MGDVRFEGLTRSREAAIDAGVGGYRKADQLSERLQNEEGLNEAARDFEKLFASMLVKEMRKTLSEGLFGEGAGTDTYGAWFDEHVGGEIAGTGALDMAGLLRAGLPKGEVISGSEIAAEYELGDGPGEAAPDPAAAETAPSEPPAGAESLRAERAAESRREQIYRALGLEPNR